MSESKVLCKPLKYALFFLVPWRWKKSKWDVFAVDCSPRAPEMSTSPHVRTASSSSHKGKLALDILQDAERPL